MEMDSDYFSRVPYIRFSPFFPAEEIACFFPNPYPPGVETLWYGGVSYIFILTPCENLSGRTAKKKNELHAQTLILSI